MNRKWLTVVLLLSLGANAALGGVLLSRLWRAGTGRPAGRADRREAAQPGWRESRLGKQLGLGAAQIEALEAQGRELDRWLLPLREKLREERRRLIGLLREEAPDAARLAEVERRMADLQVAVEDVFVQNFLRLKGIFTPEQERQYFQLLEERFTSRKRNSHETVR